MLNEIVKNDQFLAHFRKCKKYAPEGVRCIRILGLKKWLYY
jgi:hypothetical protein